jgi:hypothetical protein
MGPWAIEYRYINGNVRAAKVDRRVPSRVAGKPDVVPGQSAPGFDADPVVNGGPNSLLAAEVSLSHLN